jgi:drug/metabolite transporter (DMT)-like permease
MVTKRWFTEPLLAGLLVLSLYAAWEILNALHTAARGTPIAVPYASGPDFAVRMTLGVLWGAVPLVVWAGLTIIGNRIVRKQGFMARALVAFLAAVILCAPIAIRFAIKLGSSDGWRGLGTISVAIPVLAPFLAFAAYCVVGALLALFNNRRIAPTATL